MPRRHSRRRKADPSDSSRVLPPETFPTGENWMPRFQADAFDLFNHPNFNNPNVTSSNTDFGTITGSQPARNIQFGARLTF